MMNVEHGISNVERNRRIGPLVIRRSLFEIKNSRAAALTPALSQREKEKGELSPSPPQIGRIGEGDAVWGPAAIDGRCCPTTGCECLRRADGKPTFTTSRQAAVNAFDGRKSVYKNVLRCTQTGIAPEVVVNGDGRIEERGARSGVRRVEYAALLALLSSLLDPRPSHAGRSETYPTFAARALQKSAGFSARWGPPAAAKFVAKVRDFCAVGVAKVQKDEEMEK